MEEERRRDREPIRGSILQYEAEFIEDMDTLKYLAQMLDRSGDDWLSVHRNIGKVRRVWSWLGKLLRR